MPRVSIRYRYELHGVAHLVPQRGGAGSADIAIIWVRAKSDDPERGRLRAQNGHYSKGREKERGCIHLKIIPVGVVCCQ